jgi:hypothetical protein
VYSSATLAVKQRVSFDTDYVGGVREEISALKKSFFVIQNLTAVDAERIPAETAEII